MRTEDGKIIQECLNGKPQAFGILVDKYREGIYAFSYAELRDFQDAQDVTQEVFLQAYQKLRSLRNRESFAFWLYRIAYRYCVQCLRDRARRVDRDFIEDQDPRVVDAPSLDSHRESQLDESVQEALDMLPDAYREVLLLHYFGGLTIKDIAIAVGSSPAAIGMRLSRARAQLKEEMMAMMDTAFEGHRLPVGFTFRITEAIKRIKIHPMSRVSGLPWGLSLAVGVIVTVLSLNPHMSIPNDMAIPTGSPLPVEAKVLKSGEIPADILTISQTPLLASMQGEDDGAEDNLQKAPAMAAQGEDGMWAEKDSMSTPRYNFATSVVDGIIYAFGGWAQADYTATTEAYDPVADRWTKKKDMPVKDQCSSGTIDGMVYVVLSGGPMYAYDPEKDTWEEKARMPTSRTWFSVSVVDGILYVIGGANASGSFSTVEAYNPATDSWERKADMLTARRHPSTAVVDGIIYVIGGVHWENQNPTLFTTVEAYNPATDTWEKKADMPTARVCCASALNGRIYAIGGSDWNEAGLPLSMVEVYDPATDTWTTAPEMPTGRFGLSSSVVNGKIYAIGGTGVNENWGPGSRILEEYTPKGWQPSNALPQGKLPTTWGEVKSD